jgi:hypothetical protein
VLVKGEPVSALKGRADDFVWPLGGGGTLPVANTIQEPGTITPAEVPVAATGAQTSPKPKTEPQAVNQPRRPRPSLASPRPQQPQQYPQQQRSFFSPFSFFR